MTIFLYEFEYYDVDDTSIKTLRIASDPYITKPTDTPALARYDDRITDESGGGSFERWAFDQFSTFGQPSVGAGSIILENGDGELDAYRRHGFDLRALTIKTVADRYAAYSTAVVFAVLTVQNVEFDLDTVEFTVRDPMYIVQQPAQTAVFDGSNSGSSDLEGTPETAQGLIKPYIYGPAKRFVPVLVNPTTLIYAMNFDADGDPIAVNSVDEVLDGTAVISKDTSIGTSGNFTTAAGLAGATIASGKYATCLALGLIRLQTLPTFVLQVSATEGANSAARTMAQCVKRFLLDRYGITVNAASVTALDGLNSAEVGIYVDDDRPGTDVITELLQGDIAFCLPKISGEFTLGRLTDPASGTPVDTITQNESLDQEGGFKRVPLADPAGGLPSFRTTVNYLKYHRVLTETEIVTGATAADKEAAKKEYRASDPDEDLAVKTAYLSAPAHEINSLFVLKSAADTAAARAQSIRGVLRDVWIVPVQSDTLLNIGDVITLQDDRYGLESGEKGVIIGYIIPELTGAIINYGVLI